MSNISVDKVYTNGCELPVSGSALDTLAQLRQIATAQPTFQKRARSKFFSLPLATRLADHAKLVVSPEMEKGYRNTIYCSAVITQDDGKLTTKYCSNRWCLICNRIRTARAIEAYMPVLESWDDPHFVTLTIRNVPASELCERRDAWRIKDGILGDMLRVFKLCGLSIRRGNKRLGRAPMEFQAVRKLECTYSIERGDFHPHFHALVNGRAQAERLVEGWLLRFPERAEAPAQDLRRCEGDGSLIELFKYFTKLTTKTKDGRSRRVIPINALHTIFFAMRGRRVWQPCGFTLLEDEEESIEGEELEVEASSAYKRIEDAVFWQWDQDLSDWIDAQTGELLSEYVPGDGFKAFVESINDTPSIHQVDAVTAS